MPGTTHLCTPFSQLPYTRTFSPQSGLSSDVTGSRRLLRPPLLMLSTAQPHDHTALCFPWQHLPPTELPDLSLHYFASLLKSISVRTCVSCLRLYQQKLKPHLAKIMHSNSTGQMTVNEWISSYRWKNWSPHNLATRIKMEPRPISQVCGVCLATSLGSLCLPLLLCFPLDPQIVPPQRIGTKRCWGSAPGPQLGLSGATTYIPEDSNLGGLEAIYYAHVALGS